MVFRPKEKQSIILFFGGRAFVLSQRKFPKRPADLKTGHVRRYPVERTLFSWMPRGMHTDPRNPYMGQGKNEEFPQESL
jgi:hypothetical protein